MAWTYNILSKGTDSDGIVIVEVQFLSDVGSSYTFNKLFRPSSLDDLKVGINNTLIRQTSFDNQTSTIPNTGTLSDLTPTPTPTPSAFQTEQLKFQTDWLHWRQIKSGIDAGIIDGTNANVVAFQTKVKNEFSQIIADAQTGGATTAQAWAIALNLL